MGLFEQFPYTNFHELNLDWFVKTFKELLRQWDEQQQEFSDLKDAWEALHDYVENYFDNLDVQNEINAKLDEMKNSGELAQILAPLLHDFESEYDQRLTVLSSRMDTFASLPAGSTSGNAELLDIRVGANGITYASAGDAVRGQVSDLSQFIYGGTINVRFTDTGHYYTGPNTKTASNTFNCTELTLGKNVESINIHGLMNLGTQFIVFMLLDINRNEIYRQSGIGAGLDYSVLLKDFPNAVYAQINDFGPGYYTSVGIKFYEMVTEGSMDIGVYDNMLTPDMIIDGYWCNGAGTIAALAGCSYAKIPIPSGVEYISVCYKGKYHDPAALSNLVTGRAIFTDAVNNIIQTERPQDYIAPEMVDGLYYITYPVPAGAAFINLTARLVNTWDERKNLVAVPSNKIVFTGVNVLQISNYNIADVELRDRLLYADPDNWTAYTWLMIGDSLTQKTTRAANAYYDYIRAETGVNLINKGSSGLGFMRGPHYYYDALATVGASDFDFCTFFGSGNDVYYWDGQQAQEYPASQWPTVLGNITDTGFNTICGCINETFSRFISLFPLKQFGVITPTPWEAQASNGRVTGSHMDDYVNKLIEICEARGVPYIDLYHSSGMRPWDAAFKTEYYTEGGVTDGVHPNSAGHKWFSKMIKAFMKQFIV